MGHNDGTQSPSHPMPKHPHILKREGQYYHRKRIPADPVRAGCYGKAKEIKPSLKTGDLATANRLARTVALQVDADFEAIWERITGHSSGKKVSRRYGRYDELPMLKKAIDKIEFPDVDFSALRPNGGGGQ